MARSCVQRAERFVGAQTPWCVPWWFERGSSGGGLRCPIAGQQFQHGVASGDPLGDRVMLWTRVTVETDDHVDLAWRVARDEGLRDIVASGTTATDPTADQTVHVDVDVDGLEPATTY